MRLSLKRSKRAPRSSSPSPPTLLPPPVTLRHRPAPPQLAERRRGDGQSATPPPTLPGPRDPAKARSREIFRKRHRTQPTDHGTGAKANAPQAGVWWGHLTVCPHRPARDLDFGDFSPEAIAVDSQRQFATRFCPQFVDKRVANPLSIPPPRHPCAIQEWSVN